MTVGYLLNQYPMPSQTFVRREIAALEREGRVIRRYSIRSGEGQVVDAGDLAELERTRVVLGPGAGARLASAVLRTAVRRPRRFLSTLRRTLSLARGSRRGLGVHVVYLAEACILREWFEQDGIHHVHSHFGTNGPLVALLVRSLGGPTYSFTVHGPEEFDSPESLRLRDKIHEAVFVVAISSFGRSQLFRWCDRADWPKVQVVHCGLDEDFLRREPTPTPDVPRLVCVGRLGEQKGQVLLVEAVGQLLSQGREVELVLAGEGPMRAQLEAGISAAGATAEIRITGWLDNEQVREVVAGSRALVLASFAEGLPVALMESLAMGRAVVTTAIAGVPELVDETCGWVVPAGSVDDLVAALEQVLDTPTPELDRMGLIGRQRVMADHDASREAARLGELFDRRDV